LIVTFPEPPRNLLVSRAFVDWLVKGARRAVPLVEWLATVGEQSVSHVKRAPTGGLARRDAWTVAAIGAALATSVLALYAQTRAFGFLNLDDDYLLVRRPIVSDGLSWRGVWWALSSFEVDWRPLTWLSHMVDFSVFGADPGPQHLVNAAIH